MFGINFFTAKNEVCDVFRIDSGLHVLVHQPRRQNTLDASNRTSGFLIYDDVVHPQILITKPTLGAEKLLSELQNLVDMSGVAIYAPKIALLPPEGGINSGLLSYLRAQEGIKLELVDTLEAGAYMKKIIKGISKNRRSSLLASAFAQSGNRLDAYSRALQSMKDDVALVRVSVSGDSSELDKTLSFLRETGLARAETYEALKFVVKNFVDEKIGLASGKIKKKTLAGQIADVARNRPPPAPT